MISRKNDLAIEQFIDLTDDLLKNELFIGMKQYNHHGKIDTHFHSVYVAYTVLNYCNRLNTEPREIVRASLLHDFYLYDWHIEKHDEMHAWYHPKTAVANIRQHIGELTPQQENMILSHMWPLHLMPPKTLGGWLLTIADKHCSNEDYLGKSEKFREIYNEINKRTEK